MASSAFLRALQRELAAIRAEPPTLLETKGRYGLLELHNLSHYRNSELAWTMNRNHLLPAWRLTVGE